MSRASLPPLWHYRLRWVAAVMAFICTFVFTGGPLMAQTYDAHRKRMEREERILKNLGLDKETLAKNRAQTLPETVKERPSGRYAFDLHKPIEPGEIGNLTGALRGVEDDIFRKEMRIGRDPLAVVQLGRLYEDRAKLEEGLTVLGINVAELKAKVPPKPRYTRPLGPVHKEVKPTPRLPRTAPISRDLVGEERRDLRRGATQATGSSSPSAPVSGAVPAPTAAKSPSLWNRLSSAATGALAAARLRGSPTPVATAYRPPPTAYYQGNPDLSETPETRRGAWVEEVWAAIVAVTERTNITALDIYQYVYNKIDIEWYYGSKKGAEATLLDMSGSDFDQASLLIALLRANNIPARYVYSTVRVDAETAKNLTGADSVFAAYLMFQNAGFPVGGISSDGFEFEHAMVLAYVPKSGTFGLGLSSPTAVNEWVTLDPWAKGYEWTHEHDLAAGYVFDKTAFLNATLDISAVEWAELSFREALRGVNDGCTSLGVVGRTKTITENRESSLPDKLMLQEVVALEEFAEVPDEYRHKVTYSLLNQWGQPTYTYETLVADTIHKPVRPGVGPLSQADADLITQYGGIENVPYYMIQLVPTLYVADQAVATASMPFVSGEELTFVIEMMYPNFAPDRVEHAVVSGGNYVDVLLNKKVPQKLLTALREQLKEVEAQIATAGGNDAALQATRNSLIAYQLALTYYKMVFENQEKVERYLGAVFPALTVDSFGMKSLNVLRGWFGEPVRYYLRDRHYDPFHARFLSVDRAISRLNLYASLELNPISFTDSFGLWGFEPTANCEKVLISKKQDIHLFLATAGAARLDITGYQFIYYQQGQASKEFNWPKGAIMGRDIRAKVRMATEQEERQNQALPREEQKCGGRVQGTNEIKLYSDALSDPGCGRLWYTLLHEFIHVAMEKIPYPNWSSSFCAYYPIRGRLSCSESLSELAAAWGEYWLGR